MRLLLSIFFALSVSQSIFAQDVYDTINTPKGQLVLFMDNSWAYLEDLEFDGIMNDHLQALIDADTSINFVQKWDNKTCYTSDYQNDPSRLSDTLWMCVNDDIHNDFSIPFTGTVTSRYGPRSGRNHNGIDIDLETGDTVRAAWSGKIRYAMYNEGGFGNLVIIRHHNGLETFYAHLSKHLVMPNQDVKAGDPIGLGGNTGRSFGSHLHFEVRFFDAPINPEEVIDFDRKEVKNENLLVHRGLFRPGARPSDEFDSRSVASSASGSAKKYYRIKSGDTLSSIARKNHTTVSSLCRLNGIRPTSIIQEGKSLRIR